MAALFLKKDLSGLRMEASPEAEGGAQLERALGPFSLTMLGIGAIIGAGIFSLTGTAAALYAGPGIVYSFLLGGVLCALTGLCYAELAAMVPVSGSAYTYAYATLGELIAWIVGWDLILEYAFSTVVTASAWSAYFYSLFHKTFRIPFPDTLTRLTKGPWELVTLADGNQVHGLWNVPTSAMVLVLAAILFWGVKESAFVNTLIVLVKVLIVLVFIILGWSVVDPANWVGNSAVSGLASLVPPRTQVLHDGRALESFGWPGVLTGAGVVFFAYIGFDMIATTAQECKNPKRDLPIGMFASLIICTALYVLMSLVLTGVTPYSRLAVGDPVAVGIDRIVEIRGWPALAARVFTTVIKTGALLGLTSGCLVAMMGQTRIFYVMGKDGLLPWFDRVHPKYKTPHIATWVTGALIAVCGGTMPMSLVGELVSIGTLLAFILVCAGVLILRVKNPQAPRPFKAPFVWAVAPVGALACFWVMTGLPRDTWLRLLVWLVIGFVVYFTYSIRHSRLRLAEAAGVEGETQASVIPAPVLPGEGARG